MRSDGVRLTLNTHWTALEGPAAVRISNARALADELCL